MSEISVTKYNPAFRNVKGEYLKSEWTSISDVGKCFDGQLFKIEEYYEIEKKYISAAKLFLEHAGVSAIVVSGLEKYEEVSAVEDSLREVFLDIDEGSVFSLGNLDNAMKLILREFLWCELTSLDGVSARIKFGYDYYMYFSSEGDVSGVADDINQLGLFGEL